jgi:hypothetical protein
MAVYVRFSKSGNSAIPINHQGSNSSQYFNAVNDGHLDLRRSIASGVHVVCTSPNVSAKVYFNFQKQEMFVHVQFQKNFPPNRRGSEMAHK